MANQSNAIDECSRGKSCKKACINKNWVCKEEISDNVAAGLTKASALLSKGLSKIRSTITPPRTAVPTKRRDRVSITREKANRLLSKYSEDLNKARKEYFKISNTLSGIKDKAEFKKRFALLRKKEEGYAVIMNKIRNEMLKTSMSSSDIKRVVESVLPKEYYGDTRIGVQSRKDLEEFIRMFKGKGLTLDKETPKDTKTPQEVYLQKGGRGWASPERGEMLIDGNKNTLYHEIGHFIEQQRPWLYKFSKSWVEEKAFNKEEAKDVKSISGKPITPIKYAKGKNGENLPIYRIRDVLDDKLYKESEITYVDNFHDEYMGKIYSKFRSTEVISVAIERFSHPRTMVMLHLSHPELFELIVGLSQE